MRVEMEQTRTELIAEIERLKAEMELRTKERDQAIDCAGLDFAGTDIYNASGMRRGCSKGFPGLYAYLAGMEG